MFDRVGKVHLLAIERGLVQRAQEHRARWPHERTALQVFGIAWLLADEHHRGVRGPFPEDGLRGLGKERACIAVLRGVRESGSIFAVPTYAFLGGFLALIVCGLVRYAWGGDLTAEPVTEE